MFGALVGSLNHAHPGMKRTSVSLFSVRQARNASFWPAESELRRNLDPGDGGFVLKEERPGWLRHAIRKRAWRAGITVMVKAAWKKRFVIVPTA